MDNNLKLLALGSLYYGDNEIKKQIDAIDGQNLDELVFGENPKYEWFDCIPEIEKQLLAINITEKQFEKITLLSGECCKTHHLIMPNWDGEGDEFAIKSFSGVEIMVNLKKLEFLDFTSAKDIERLFELGIEEIDEYCGLSDDHKRVFIDMGVKVS